MRAVWLSAAGESPLGSGVRSASADYRGGEDRVWLDSGDTLDGRLVKLQDRVLTFETAGEAIEIEAGRVAAVALAGQETKPTGRMAIGLEDGTLLYARQASMTPDSLSVTLDSGEELRGGSGRAVWFVQSLSPNIQYLSDLEPLDYQHTPYLSVPWPLSPDHGLTGQQLQAGGRRYLKGLAMHSASRVVYRLAGDWRRFEAELAIDQDAGRATPGGSVTFRVLVARDAGFEPAYESPILRAGDKPLPISVDVSGAKAIALLVDFADYGDQQDHADWLDARLVK